ncbi:DNA primase [Candidatus Saccharibacteria bacterium CG10_big_fil_rev_8_21_14_0_10_47_8]|nr:MAG: DNA primase [Candidatus Saccharibacteria bacterium CG10_big_fil_rev_8_21_14_0_10_47_8]
MDAVAEVKARLNIEDVIGEYVQLKRAGRNFKGLSPFTSEKTASFVVSPEKQIWHDFSSGKGGDIFSFVMEVEGLEFKATLEMLARKAGVELEQFQGKNSSGNTERKKRALEVLELATRFYQKQLTVNKSALTYLLKTRGFTKQTLLDWHLGYAPQTAHALTDFLTKHGFTTDEMKRAGLVVQRYSGASDMFRGRIMIPLCDSRGTVIGFTARLLDVKGETSHNDSPKYINTPQTAVYDKSRQVYGLHLAKEAIRKTGFVVVAEGNLDVISSHQAGITNVVASAGTAMTEQHLRELKRFTGDIRLSFDSDRAGINATERVIPLAQKTEVNLRIITIKDAKDPDELVRKDPKAWQQAIEDAKYALDWLVERYQAELDLKTASGKKAFTDALLLSVRRLRDQVEQEHYLKHIAKLTDSSYEAVRSKMESSASNDITPRRKIPKNQPNTSRSELEYQRLQDHFLAMVLMQPKLRDLLGDCQQSFFSGGPPREVFKFLKKNPDFLVSGATSIATSLQGVSDYVKIITLQFEELYKSLAVADLGQEAVKLKRRLISDYVKTQKHRLAITMDQTNDEKELADLMGKANKLNDLIKIIKSVPEGE